MSGVVPPMPSLSKMLAIYKEREEQERGRAEARGVALCLGMVGAAVAGGLVLTWAYHENRTAPYRAERDGDDVGDQACASALASILGDPP